MFEQKFESMLRKYGSVIDDKKKFTGLVKDFFSSQVKNINLLLMAYDLGLAADLQVVGRINNTFAFRYVKQLTEDYGVSRVNADWIVSVWCVCYGKNVLGKECEIKIEPIHAITHCEDCGTDYDTVPQGRICPNCGSEKTFLLQGNEFMIKEIEAY